MAPVGRRRWDLHGKVGSFTEYGRLDCFLESCYNAHGGRRGVTTPPPRRRIGRAAYMRSLAGPGLGRRGEGVCAWSHAECQAKEQLEWEAGRDTQAHHVGVVIRCERPDWPDVPPC